MPVVRNKAVHGQGSGQQKHRKQARQEEQEIPAPEDKPVRYDPLVAEHHEGRDQKDDRNRQRFQVIDAFDVIEDAGGIQTYMEQPQAESREGEGIHHMNRFLALLYELAERYHERKERPEEHEKV